MRLRPERLNASLKKTLAPVYLISGDEPLQIQEAADAIRSAAYKAGYDNREVFSVDAGFSWHAWLQAANAGSIFAERKIIDLRIPSGKPGAEGSKALLSYCERLPDDTLLLITTGKLPTSAKTAKWVQRLEKTGVFIQAWPLQGGQLIEWLQQRLKQKGMQANQTLLQVLADRIEGNLSAAAQEVEKLYVLFGPGKLDTQAVLDTVSDNSRYDVFVLIDNVLSAQADRSIKIFHGLKAEGIAAPVMLWALTREVRLLAAVKQQLKQGLQRNTVFRKNNIWEKRQPLVNSALQRLTVQHLHQAILLSAVTDRQIKGEAKGDGWETLMKICLLLSGADLRVEKV